MNTDHFQKLSAKLNLNFENSNVVDLEDDGNGNFSPIAQTQNQLPATVNTNTSLAVANTVVADRRADEEKDYNRVRASYETLITTGNAALTDLLYIARTTSEPRAFEVIAGLIKSMNETNKQLYGIHEESRRAKQTSTHNPGGLVNPQQNYIEKAVFVGSHNDLLDKVKKDNDTPKIEATDAEVSPIENEKQ